MDWQPIETAPKNGSVVLLYCPNGVDRPKFHFKNNDMTICLGYFGDMHGSYGPFDKWVSIEMDGDIVQYGEYTGACFETEMISVYPTHWMPIPPSPSNET